LTFLAFVHLGKGTESIPDAGAAGYIPLLKQQSDHESEDQHCGP